MELDAGNRPLCCGLFESRLQSRARDGGSDGRVVDIAGEDWEVTMVMTMVVMMMMMMTMMMNDDVDDGADGGDGDDDDDGVVAVVVMMMVMVMNDE